MDLIVCNFNTTKAFRRGGYWVVIECGVISEKVCFKSLDECRQYIYDCLRDDRGHKYKLEQITELNRIIYSRLIVDYTVKIIKINGEKKLILEANMENISQAGCKIKINNLPTSFAVDEHFTIQFNLADFNLHKSGKLEIEAIVRWTSLDGSEVGCKFTEMNDESEEIFTSILKTLLI